MRAQMRIVFDIIVTLLGIFIIYNGIVSKHKGTVASFFIPDADLKKVKDHAGLCKYLFPVILIFGTLCIVFGIESFINDTIYELPKTIYFLSLLAFLGLWTWFSAMLKKAKDKFVSKF